MRSAKKPRSQKRSQQQRRRPRRNAATASSQRNTRSLRIIGAQQRKIEHLDKWRRRLSLLLRFTKRASTTTKLEDLLLLLVEEAKAVLNAERATVFLVDKRNGELWSKVATGTEPIRVPLNKGIAGSVVTSGKLLNIRDVYKDQRFNPEVDRKTGYHTKSVLAAPMFSRKNDVIGVFQVLNRKNGQSFDRQDEEILTLLTDQASGHVENAQLYHEIRRTSQETIIRLAAAVEFKDHDTRAHLWRMSQYSALIAREMGFSPEWAENVRLAAPMHDIGKIGVPDAILNKPGKLTEEEWIEMKKHPVHGAEILKDAENELMQMSATIALCHHEKWDGSGYPRGLKGEEIPIEARIATLADVFDALTSKRIYKPSFSLEETLDIINRDSGKHFDPRVVDAFMRCLPQITPIMERYAPRDGHGAPAPLPAW
ncbi:MAG: HD domain-containing protein [Elusimicrobia bacterium]|nr:HD domain-containing protein [Elusimicrobiota bacterium]